MKKNLILIALVTLLNGCGNETSGQIEGIKWADNFSKLGDSQAYTSFIDGKIMSCVKNKGTWIAVTTYKLNGNKLTIPADENAKDKKLFAIKIKGSGKEKVLIMTRTIDGKSHEMKFPVSTNPDCPIPR